jgi:hypothetical protein
MFGFGTKAQTCFKHCETCGCETEHVEIELPLPVYRKGSWTDKRWACCNEENHPAIFKARKDP